MVWVSVNFLFGAFYQVQNGSFFSNFLGSRISLYQPTGVHNPHCFMLVSTSPDAPRKHRENPGNGRISEKLDEANLLINPPCQGDMKGIERQHANYLLNHKYSCCCCCCCCCCCWWWWWMRFPDIWSHTIPQANHRFGGVKSGEEFWTIIRTPHKKNIQCQKSCGKPIPKWSTHRHMYIWQGCPSKVVSHSLIANRLYQGIIQTTQSLDIWHRLTFTTINYHKWHHPCGHFLKSSEIKHVYNWFTKS